MLVYYLILDILPDATDEEIRNNYLRLVKKFTPEKDPERFRKITEAYEAIKDKQRRVQGEIFWYQKSDYENAIYALADAKQPERRRVTLRELIHEAI